MLENAAIHKKCVAAMDPMGVAKLKSRLVLGVYYFYNLLLLEVFLCGVLKI